MKYARRRDVEKRALVRALRLMFEEGVLLRGNRTVFFDQAFTP
jgi:formyltetrahydrofolate hydrolase